MKILNSTPTILIVADRGFDSRHWGFLALLLSVGGFIAMRLSGKEVPGPAYLVLGIFFIFGIFAALFMTKRLRHQLDKANNVGLVEIPVLLDTKHSKETFRLSDVVAVTLESPTFLETALMHGESPSGANRGLRAMLGFSYRLRDGGMVSGGVYSTNIREIRSLVDTISRFLEVPAEQ